MCTGQAQHSPLSSPSSSPGRPRGQALRAAALPGEPHGSTAEGDGGGGVPINLGDLVSQHRAQEHQKRQAERCGLRAFLSLTGISGQETQEFVGTQEELRVLITYLAP